MRHCLIALALLGALLLPLGTTNAEGLFNAQKTHHNAPHAEVKHAHAPAHAHAAKHKPTPAPRPTAAPTPAVVWHTVGRTWVTGYDDSSQPTATGTHVHWGTLAVDPRVIPLGAWVEVPGLGLFHAEDTGGAVIGAHVDVWWPDEPDCYSHTGWYEGVRWHY